MKNRESEEMYLETIYVLKRDDQGIRAVDIAKKLGYSKASVSLAMKRLKAKGYITVDQSGVIHLSESGQKTAAEVLERHHLLTRLFIKIGASPTVAELNACRMEHVISEELIEVLREYINNSEHDFAESWESCFQRAVNMRCTK